MGVYLAQSRDDSLSGEGSSANVSYAGNILITYAVPEPDILELML